MKATSEAATASLAFGETAALAGYRVLHAGATSEPEEMRTCADYSGNWVRVALSRITPPGVSAARW